MVSKVLLGEKGISTEQSHSRALLLFVSFISGYDNVHIRTNLPRVEDALKYGQSAGDR